VHGQSNVGAAIAHFLSVATRETVRLSAMTDKARLQYALDWLQNAEAVASRCYSVGGFNPRTELNHQTSWLQAFRRFLDVTQAL
jgi:hypothetical protein